MLLVIPEIQLIKGECKMSITGEDGTEALYKYLSKNPDELCSLFRRENAKSIHVLDVDSILGHDNNLNLNMILYLAQAVDIPVQVYSNFINPADCRSMLNNGVYRIIIDELAYLNPGGIKELINDYTASRVVFYLYAKNGKVSFDRADISSSAKEYAEYIKTLGANRVIYGDEDWERKGAEPDLEMLKDFSASTGLRVTIANGIRRPEQLWRVNAMKGSGIDSVIIGKSLYTNNFPCQKIWRKIEAELEPGLLPGNICLTNE